MTNESTDQANHSEDPTEWGNYQAPQIYDNEDFDNPLHELDFDEVIKLKPVYKVVRYQNVDLEDSRLATLAKSDVVQNAEYLDIGRNFRSLTDEGVAALVRTGALKHLSYLSIDNCYALGDETVKAIAEGHMPALVGLALGSTEITDQSLVQLANKESLPQLRVLVGEFLSNLTDEGMTQLAEARPEMLISIYAD